MNGRLERDLRIQKNLERILLDKPKLFTDWYHYMESGNTSEKTCYSYISYLCLFWKYAKENYRITDVSDITLQITSGYMNSIRTKTVRVRDKKIKDPKDPAAYIIRTEFTSDSHKQTVWSALNGFMKYAVLCGVIKENYMAHIKRSKNNDLNKIMQNRVNFGQDDYKKLILGVDIYQDNYKLVSRDKAILMILMSTGLRCSALIEANVEDYDIEKCILHVTDKGDKKLEYHLNADVAKNISEWIREFRNSYEDIAEGNNKNALFLSFRGKRLDISSVTKIINKYAEPMLHKKLSPHKFRAGFCTAVYSKTKDIELTRRAVGHSNISTTQRYIATDNKEKEIAAEIMANMMF